MLRIEKPDYFLRVTTFAAGKSLAHLEDLWMNIWRLHCFFDQFEHVDDSQSRLTPPEMPLGIGVLSTLPEAWLALVADRVVTTLYPDFAPASFGFAMHQRKDDRFIMNGGLIYHGDQRGWDKKASTKTHLLIEEAYKLHRAGGEGHVDPLAERLTGSASQPWSIHT